MTETSAISASRTRGALSIRFDGRVSGDAGLNLLNLFLTVTHPVLLHLNATGGDFELCQQIQDAMRSAQRRGILTLINIEYAAGPACLLLSAAWLRYATWESRLGPIDHRHVKRWMITTSNVVRLPKWAFKRLQKSRLSIPAAVECCFIDRVFSSQSAADWAMTEHLFSEGE